MRVKRLPIKPCLVVRVMPIDLTVLVLEALAVYLLVLIAHALRHRFGLPFFYSLLGGLTAIMSWVTDAGVMVVVGDITFMVGSTVFYTSLLLGVFVVYVFDGPGKARIAISTVAVISALMPAVAAVLHHQALMMGDSFILAHIPMPSLRTNSASVVATVADLFFLAMAWEFLGKLRFKMRLPVRAFLTLLGVMWFDVVMFTTGAFAGMPEYLDIMRGTFYSRLIVALAATPILYLYLRWQRDKVRSRIENRPVLAILSNFDRVQKELDGAQREIELRKKAEHEKEVLIRELRATLSRVRKLEGLLPVCAGCKRIRLEGDKSGGEEQWVPLEDYVRKQTSVEFSHGLCIDCLKRNYPEVSDEVISEMEMEEEKNLGKG